MTEIETLKTGDKVLVFDPRKYVDDCSTPLSVTMCAATVLDILKDKEGSDVADVRFDYDGRISCSHFVWGIKAIT